MKKSEFLDKMIDVKNDSAGNYMCNILANVFNPRMPYWSAGQRKRSLVVKLYKSVIKGKDSRHYGMYGHCFDKESQDARQISLEIFERVVIDEKLYKEL